MARCKKQQRIPSDEYLSPAQTRVAVALCKGYDDKEVADKLCMSKHTVARHKQDIYERTGIRHTANALVAWFLAINFTIAVEDLERRLGAMVLAVLFSVFTFGADNDTQLVRRARRGRRCRREYEYVIEA
ncbi:MAG: hypothetical protein E7141_04770 [Rikenellaceae bacterium]|nr:hypothetical protein [Rikenellaceae bacterium]